MEKTANRGGFRMQIIDNKNSILQFLENPVHDAIFYGFFCVHPIVPVKILHHLLKFFATIFGQDPGADIFYPSGLAGSDLEVDANPLHVSAEARLVDHDLRKGIYEPAALLSPAEEDRPHGCRQTHTDRTDRAFEHLHGIVDDNPGCDNPAGAVDKEFD